MFGRFVDVVDLLRVHLFRRAKVFALYDVLVQLQRASIMVGAVRLLAVLRLSCY